MMGLGLPASISWGNHSSVFGRAAQAIEHPPCGEGNLADGFLAVALVAQKCRHHADYVGAALDEDDSGIVADGFECAGLVGDSDVGGQVAGNPRGFIRAQDSKEVGSRFRAEHLATVDGFEEIHHLAGR
jgi:hypothetical protein